MPSRHYKLRQGPVTGTPACRDLLATLTYSARPPSPSQQDDLARIPRARPRQSVNRRQPTGPLSSPPYYQEILSTIIVAELTMASEVIQGYTYSPIEVFALVSVLYWFYHFGGRITRD